MQRFANKVWNCLFLFGGSFSMNINDQPIMKWLQGLAVFWVVEGCNSAGPKSFGLRSRRTVAAPVTGTPSDGSVWCKRSLPEFPLLTGAPMTDTCRSWQTTPPLVARSSSSAESRCDRLPLHAECWQSRTRNPVVDENSLIKLGNNALFFFFTMKRQVWVTKSESNSLSAQLISRCRYSKYRTK